MRKEIKSLYADVIGNQDRFSSMDWNETAARCEYWFQDQGLTPKEENTLLDIMLLCRPHVTDLKRLELIEKYPEANDPHYGTVAFAEKCSVCECSEVDAPIF